MPSEEIKYNAVQPQGPGVEAFLRLFSTGSRIPLNEREYGIEGAILCAFEPLDPLVAGTAREMDNRGKAFSLAGILDSPSVRKAVADLYIPTPIPADLPGLFWEYNAFELEGFLTYLLLSVHWKSGKLQEEEARHLSRAFLEDLLPTGRETARAYRSEHSWTPWFRTIYMNGTILILDGARQRWILFCYTVG